MPFHTARAFSEMLKQKGVRGGLSVVKKARHIHDLKLKPGGKGWDGGVGVGYEFLFMELGLK